jgi:ABC-type multidrug transport system ATPase subunit
LLILDEPSDGLDPEGIHEMRHTILRLHKELGLTILLSSHLLNEVQQLCTRIAVLNQGRKMFDGLLSDAKKQQQWVRLRVDDFDRAVKLLRSEGLITAERDSAFIQPGEHVGTERIVRALVASNIAVYEIAREQETLEQFYLSLMKEQN